MRATLGDALDLYLKGSSTPNHRGHQAWVEMNIFLFELPGCEKWSDVKKFVSEKGQRQLDEGQQRVFDKLLYCWTTPSF